MMTVVCRRYKTNDTRGRPAGIGRTGCTDPHTGKPFHDDADTWKTHNACCQNCGEMLGTSRPRWGANRWPATVVRDKCEQCGAECCSACRQLFMTREVIGFYNHRTEGGHTIKRPHYRERALCTACGNAESTRIAALPRQPTLVEQVLDFMSKTNERQPNG